MRKKTGTLLVGTGTVLLLALFIGCGGQSGAKEYQKAVQAWKGGDLVRARTLLEKSIRKTSGNERKSIAQNQLGVVLWELGEIDAAAEAFGKSCNLTETPTAANLNQGIALFHAGQLDDAERVLNNVLGNDPENAMARSTLGMVQANRRNWSGSSKELKRVVTRTPSDAAAQNMLALSELNETRNSANTIKRLKQIIASQPDYAPAAYNLAVIYHLWLNDTKTAKIWYQTYLQKSGPEGSHIDAAAKALKELGGTGSTRLKIDPEAAKKHIAAGSKLHASKKYSAAVREYQNALKADPKQKNAYYNMSLSYYAEKKYNSAAQACIDALKIDPRFTDARYMLSLTYYQQKKWSDAEREARQLKKLDAARGDQMLKYISAARK